MIFNSAAVKSAASPIKRYPSINSCGTADFCASFTSFRLPPNASIASCKSLNSWLPIATPCCKALSSLRDPFNSPSDLSDLRSTALAVSSASVTFCIFGPMPPITFPVPRACCSISLMRVFTSRRAVCTSSNSCVPGRMLARCFSRARCVWRSSPKLLLANCTRSFTPVSALISASAVPFTVSEMTFQS